jgi:hypothetical protein
MGTADYHQRHVRFEGPKIQLTSFHAFPCSVWQPNPCRDLPVYLDRMTVASPPIHLIQFFI